MYVGDPKVEIPISIVQEGGPFSETFSRRVEPLQFHDPPTSRTLLRMRLKLSGPVLDIMDGTKSLEPLTEMAQPTYRISIRSR